MPDPVDIDPARPQAFLSYAHADDDFLEGAISRLREDIQKAVPFVCGKPFSVFQDRDGIGFGQDWRDRLEEALSQARFFFPILTPSYFRSQHCRDEAFRFLEYEAAANRKDLILPIYVQDTPLWESAEQRASDNDLLAIRLAQRQYRDWRQLIHAESKSLERREAIIALAGEISQVADKRPDPEVLKLARECATLKKDIKALDQAIATERSKLEQAEAELSKAQAKASELTKLKADLEEQRLKRKRAESALSEA